MCKIQGQTSNQQVILHDRLIPTELEWHVLFLLFIMKNIYARGGAYIRKD